MRALAWVVRAVGIVLAGALLVTGVVIGVGPRLWRIANAHDQLPVTLPEFQPLSQRSYVYDVAGNVIAVFERENSQPLKLAQVPPQVLAAFLAVEDQEFYLHHGVNLRGFMRALLSNFASDAPRQGASTISQQVVKNEFLAGLPRDGRYKALQAHYATMLEKKTTKDAILERYLNTVFFGNNAYGLQAGAEVYFGKSVEQLTMMEGAFLAGLVRSPSGYDPIRRTERSRARFRQVTQRLADVGLVTPVVGQILGETWPLPEQTRSLQSLSFKPTYYTEALKEYLLQKTDLLGTTEQERANLLYRGGLQIHTTFDPTLQANAEAARAQLPATQQGFDTAIVTLDTRTAAIRAMVGGPGFEPRTNEINMALVPRQTGSSVKFFILAAALQAGAQPTDVIDGVAPCELPDPGDPKKTFILGKEVSIASRAVGTLETMTWSSINCAYARLSQIVGLNRVVDTMYRMADSIYLNRNLPDSKARPALVPFGNLAVGSNPMAPIDMAAGMQTIANQGLHHQPYFVDYIDRVDGSRVYTHEDLGTQVLDPSVALTAIQTMKGVLTKGTARRALAKFPYPATGKTGTQDDNTNSWFVGASPQLTTAVWVGDPDAYTPMVRIPEFVAVGVPKVQGGTFPAKIWGAMMEPSLAPLPVEDWPAAPKPTRKAMRLYLPGNECLGKIVSGAAPKPTGSTTTIVAPAPVDPAAPTTTVAATTPPPLVIKAIDSGTTIPPDVLDPLAPMPTVATSGVFVYNCQKTPKGVVVTGKKKG